MDDLRGVVAPDEMTRRSFVTLLGASLALAGLDGCIRRPREKILPYVNQPPELTPDMAQHYATSMVLGGFATGLLVESHAGRPTKVEGNPDHPASLGAAGVYQQASVLQLYDPHRARQPRSGQGPATWAGIAALLRPDELRRRVGVRGAGLRVLLEPTGSPLIEELVARLEARYPDARVHYYAPLQGESHAAARTIFGHALQPQYDIRRAEVILALDADFLGAMPFHLRYARQFAAGRRLAGPDDRMSRLYVAEGIPTPTGAVADHRLRLRPSEIGDLAAMLLGEVMARGTRVGGMPPEVEAKLRASSGTPHDWARAAARDLTAARGRGLVIAGDRQPARVHALAHLLNAALGNVGTTVRYSEPTLLAAGNPARGLAPLVEELRAGQVTALVILEGNPSYTAPVDAELSRYLRDLPLSLYLGLYRNETAGDCAWYVPALHYLEAWGDARAYDGTASLVQPLIAPLYGGKTPAQLLAALDGTAEADSHVLVRESWRRRVGMKGFEHFWDAALQRGIISGTAAAVVEPQVAWSSVAALLDVPPTSATARSGTLELAVVQDPRVYDGSFANNPWLQELPDPATKLTWDNAALLAPSTARRLGVTTGDMVDLDAGGRGLRAAVQLLPGLAEQLVALGMGYGRSAPEEPVAHGRGFDAFRLCEAATPYFRGGVAITPASAVGKRVRYRLASTQTHWSMEGRPIVLSATLGHYRAHPDFTRPERDRTLSLYPPSSESGDQWGMVIDLARCTGCSACVVACQAENNIPVVGKEGVLDGREMHWLRIDRYLEGPADEPEVLHQPMLCQHCERAPCEYVCPVGATAHSPDGLNEMTYNRCVGTRFCSNNCPYKVRRFNWFDYNAEVAETERMVKNPSVTVRARGVMEKCTFCVQRIRNAQIHARLEDRPLATGEVRTACQQACPSEAIAFGSITDPASEVTRGRAEPRSYAVLHELGTEPRVRYLAKITNPSSLLEPRSDDS